MTTSKTHQFCETSKNEAILRDFIQKWKVENKFDGLVPLRVAIFPFHLFKVLRLVGKSEARSYEVLCLSCKIILANLKISCSKMQPLSGNLRADLLTLRLPREMHLYGSFSNVPRLPSFLEMLQSLHVSLTFDKVHNPLRLPRETTPERPKVFRTRQFFCTFDFEMCFATTACQKCSENGVFCTFWLGNVLRATTACILSSSQLPKVV